MNGQVAVAVGCTASAVAALCGGFGWWAARRATDPSPSRHTAAVVRPGGTGTVWVSDGPPWPSTAVSRWGLRWPDGTVTVVSGVRPAPGRGVVCDVADGHGRAGEAVWTGVCHARPEDVTGADGVRCVAVRAGDGVSMPAWVLPAGDGQVWAVLVPGLGSRMAAVLRAVPVLRAAGVTCLVVGCRNSADGPRVGRGRFDLGETWARDVAAAVRHAVGAGAARVLLVGFSAGAAAVLRAAADDRNGAVCAVVAESPVLGWDAALRHGLSCAGVPAWAGRLVWPWLRTGLLSRLVGLERPARPSRFDWLSGRLRPRVPVLVLQGRSDLVVPVSGAVRFGRLWPEMVPVRMFDCAHTHTWNVDPERWDRLVSAWLRDVVLPVRAG